MVKRINTDVTLPGDLDLDRSDISILVPQIMRDIDGAALEQSGGDPVLHGKITRKLQKRILPSAFQSVEGKLAEKGRFASTVGGRAARTTKALELVNVGMDYKQRAANDRWQKQLASSLISGGATLLGEITANWDKVKENWNKKDPEITAVQRNVAREALGLPPLPLPRDPEVASVLERMGDLRFPYNELQPNEALGVEASTQEPIAKRPAAAVAPAAAPLPYERVIEGVTNVPEGPSVNQRLGDLKNRIVQDRAAAVAHPPTQPLGPMPSDLVPDWSTTGGVGERTWEDYWRGERASRDAGIDVQRDVDTYEEARDRAQKALIESALAKGPTPRPLRRPVEKDPGQILPHEKHTFADKADLWFLIQEAWEEKYPGSEPPITRSEFINSPEWETPSQEEPPPPPPPPPPIERRKLPEVKPVEGDSPEETASLLSNFAFDKNLLARFIDMPFPRGIMGDDPSVFAYQVLQQPEEFLSMYTDASQRALFQQQSQIDLAESLLAQIG